MCNEREKLIAYLYDEADAGDRREMDTHLAQCDTCRDELRGLRAVREDLLAWDVPAHESVWKPFVATPVKSSWQYTPMWARLAAAVALFAVAGAVGVIYKAAELQRVASAQAATTSASMQELEMLKARLATLEQQKTVAAAAVPQQVALTQPVGHSGIDSKELLTRVEQLIKDSEGRVNRRMAGKIVGVVQELQVQSKIDQQNMMRTISDSQAQLSGLVRVMNTRALDKEKQ